MATTSKLEALNELKKVDSIQEILNRAAEIFGNAVMINDTSYNLLCCSEGIKTDDHIWNELMTLGTFSHETVNFFKNENFIMEFAKSETVALMKSDKLKYDRINGKLFDSDGVQLGNTLVLGCYNPLTDEDIKLLEALCETLSVKLQKSPLYSKIDRVYQVSALNNLLDGVLPSLESDKKMVADLYNKLKQNLYIAIIDTSQYDETFTHLAYFRDVFRKICPHFLYFVHKENIAAILSTDNPSIKLSSDLHELDSFFKENRIYAGISDRFLDLDNAHKYAKQAYVALNYGQKCGRNSQFFSYNDYRAVHNLLKSNLELNDLYSPTALKMLEWDSTNATQYSELIYSYILYGGDKAIAGKANKLSPDEFDKSLNAAANLFEIDLTNGDMLINIYLTLKLIKSAKN